MNRIAMTAALSLLGAGFAADAARAESADKFERDRAAILAMAGEFEVTFDFKETAAVEPGYELHKPYHEQATEMVSVLEDAGDRIVLQHILVIADDDGGDPIVVKHWRQDWTYEDTRVFSYRGDDAWDVSELPAAEVAGAWSQAVYHVDDSPRYESVGTWTHEDGKSTWRGTSTWRPLPRREYTHRSDYDALVAVNIHTVTPTGWTHEQENDKLVIDTGRVLAHEHGLNVYTRTDTHDFAAGRTYWDQTSEFWAQVRSAWDAILAERDHVQVRDEIDGDSLFERIDGLVYEPADERPDVRAAVMAYVAE